MLVPFSIGLSNAIVPPLESELQNIMRNHRINGASDSMLIYRRGTGRKHYGDGDTVTLRVDSKDRRVSFAVNGVDADKHDNVEEGDYRLAISLSGKKKFVRIVDFYKSYQ